MSCSCNVKRRGLALENAVVAAIGLVAVVAAVALIWAGSTAAVGDTSATRIVHRYVQDVAAQNSYRILHERLLAYRTDGDESVARVRVTFQQTYLGQPVRAPETVVLVVKLAKSPWGVRYARVAP